jgi:hypothetical protein
MSRRDLLNRTKYNMNFFLFYLGHTQQRDGGKNIYIYINFHKSKHVSVSSSPNLCA